MLRRRLAQLLLVAALAAQTLSACRATEGRVTPAGHPRALPHAPRERSFDVSSYSIELVLEPEERAIRASCRVRFAALVPALERVSLDLVGLTVEAVSDADGQPLAFRHRNGVLDVELQPALERGAETEVVVSYSGRPERGLWFSGVRADGSGPTQVFSHGQTEGSRGWFPCFDEPIERASSEIVVTAPADWTIVAAGERVEARIEGERRTERWRMEFPHPSYLVDLVAGEFVGAESRAGSVPLQFLAEPHLAEWIGPTFEETDEILAFLEGYTGLAYPYPKYSQAAVDNFPWGGMENISATTLTPLLLSDELARRDQPSFALIAHEAAHQWFGDLFTCADWSHLWLNEGFATYCTLLYVEHSRGLDEFRAQLRETQEAYLAEDVGALRRPTVWNVWKEPDDVFDTRPYQGAAARLHLLRNVLGDEVFQQGVRRYAREQVGRSVVTADFRACMERVSGADLGPFFEQWFLRPGFPEFELAWSWNGAEQEIVLEVEQVQEPRDGTPAVFEVPVEVEVRDSRGARTFRVALDQRRERFEFPGTELPLYVRFDNHGWIPKRVHEDKEHVEWLALARLAEDVNARREAVLVLGRVARMTREQGRDPEPFLVALVARLAEDGSAWVRADAATALGEAGGANAQEVLHRAALEDEEPRVRAAALFALSGFGPDEGLASLAEDAFYSGPSYRARAGAAALLCAAAPERAFEFISSALEVETPHDVLAGLLFRELAKLPDPRVPAELRRHAANVAIAPTARALAVQGLAEVSRERLANSRFLVPFLGEDSFHLRQAAVRSLAGFGDPGALQALADYYPRSRTSVERRLIEGALSRTAP